MEKEDNVVVQCINLEKKYFLFEKDYKIIPWLFTKKGCSEVITPLTNINLTINKGDVIGFIGKNGAGKSTLMKIIAGITQHTDGALKVSGVVNSLINLGAGFNYKYTGRQNIYYKGLLMGMTNDQVDEIIDDIIDFCELDHYFDLPLYMYSSGMAARLGFALAIFADHDILIVDEVFAVGDKMFRTKSAKKMEELFRSGKSIIFASHSDEQIRQFCNRAIFIDESHIVVDGTVDEALDAYNEKYAPNKVKVSQSQNQNEDKYLELNRFMNIIKGNFERADIYREIAVLKEVDNDFEVAYKYMMYAKHIRPTGPFIIEKCKEYSQKIDKEYVESFEIKEESLKNIEKILTYLTNNNEIEKADLCRELALFYEAECDLKNAFKYIKDAKDLRPTGPFIIKKYDEIEAKINNSTM